MSLVEQIKTSLFTGFQNQQSNSPSYSTCEIRLMEIKGLRIRSLAKKPQINKSSGGSDLVQKSI